MQKELIRVLTALMISWQLSAQEQPTIVSIDSITYQQYLTGDWDGLIAMGKLAQSKGIDFMHLQQRLGFAYYAKEMYYKSKKHYLRALRYDSENEFTQLYLYYTHLFTGHTQAARSHAGKLSQPIKTTNHLKAFQLVKSLDAEYSYKQPEAFFRENELRNDAYYRRIGLLSYAGYRISLYNSLSGFQQRTDFYNTTSQLEYLGLISLQVSNSLTLQGGYRHIGTRLMMPPDTLALPGNAIVGNLNYHWNRFDIALSTHHFNNEAVSVSQWGLHWGTGFSGSIPVYFKSSIYRLIESGTNWETGESYVYPHTVFSQTAGIMVWKNRLWAEGSLTIGTQQYFSSNDGLYFHNSLDPATLKTGVLLTAYLSKNLSISIHYGYEEKYVVYINEYYYQQGITGGIQWKF